MHEKVRKQEKGKQNIGKEIKEGKPWECEKKQAKLGKPR